MESDDGERPARHRGRNAEGRRDGGDRKPRTDGKGAELLRKWEREARKKVARKRMDPRTR